MEPNMMPHVPQVAEELKELWAMTLPITAMNCVVYLRALISVLCLGRLGSLELAGGALSIGFTNITGYSVLVGLASALEPLCGQAHGCRNWELLVLSLHRAVALLLFAAVPISVLWLLMSPILLFLGQDPAITAVAATYCLYSLPDLLTNSLLQPLRVFLRSQGVAAPMFYCSALALALHLPLNLLLVFVLRLGVPGVAVAAVLTNLNMVLFMLAYLWLFCRRGKKGNTTVAGAGGGEDGGVVAPWYCWRGWGTVVKGVGPMMELAVPSCLGICLEWWWYEIMTVMAGLLPEPRVTVAAAAILIQTTSFMYTMPMALAACVSTRVGNELGAGKPARAKLAAIVALGCAFVMGVVNVTWTAVLRERWARFFTTDEAVVAVAAAVMPIMGLCELGNCPQTTGCGVLRGTARPALGARINLACFYGVGTPVAVGLAFGLAVGFNGLWYGLLSAQVACAASVLFVVLVKTDWEVEAHRAHKLTQVEMGRVVVSNGRPMEGEEEEKKRFLEKDVENAL